MPKKIKPEEETRGDYIMVWTTSKTKARLQEIADESNFTLSSTVHWILQDWLEQQAPVEEDEDEDD